MNHLRNITAFLVLLLWSCVALAAATVITVQGDVQMIPLQGSPSKLAPGQRIETGASIKTSANGEISLRFDDGQMLALSPSTSFIINEYKFNPHKPEESSFIASLLKGGLRAVTGIIGETNKNNVTFKTDVATVGIRGTDFMLHHGREMYLSVLEGAISANNAAGEEVFDAKLQPFGMVANAQNRPRPTQKDMLPAEVEGAFRILQALPLSDKIRKPNPQDPTCGDRR